MHIILWGWGKTYIGVKCRGCRFCNKHEPEVTFRKIAHAVPEFLGNRQLFLRNECDECNKAFSNLESHLDKFCKPYRCSSGIKGKNKVPSVKSKEKDKNKQTRFDHRPDHIPVITAPAGGKSSIHPEEGIVKYEFDIESYIPQSVYKCLVKIGLSVIPEAEILNFKNLKEWILDTGNRTPYISPLKLHKTFIPGNQPHQRKLVVSVYKKIEYVRKAPMFTMCIGFGNISYQIMLPSDCDGWLADDSFPWELSPIPHEFNLPYGRLERKYIDMTSPELLKGEVHTIEYSAKIVKLQELIGKTPEQVKDYAMELANQRKKV